MWIRFFVGVALLAALLYLPGWGFLQCSPLRRTLRLALAPVVTVPVLALTTMAYSGLGVSCTWWNVMLPMVVLGLVGLALGMRVRRAQCLPPRSAGKPAAGAQESQRLDDSRSPWLTLLLFVAASVVVTGLVFVKTLDGPSSFAQAFDNYAHLRTVRQFVETGVWTTGGFSGYPSAFYLVAALVVSLTGCEVTFAVNVTMTVLLGLVWGTSMFAFLGHIFKDAPSLWAWGALSAVTVSACPWFLLNGVLYPNLMGMVLAPGVMCLFMRLVDDLPRHVVWNGALFLLGLVGMALSHPNTVFLCVLVLTPFCCSRVYRAVDAWKGWRGTAWRRAVSIGAAALFLAVVVAVWVTLALLPSFSAVVNFAREPLTTLPNALADFLTLTLNDTQGVSVAIAALFWIGCAYVVVTKRYLWLIGSYLLTMPAYLYCLSVPMDDPLRPLISGFWYHDYGRVASVVGMTAIPLVAVGLWVLWRALRGLAASRDVSPCGLDRLAMVLAAGFCALALFPNVTLNGGMEVKTGFGPLYAQLSRLNSEADDGGNLSAAEVAFIERAFEEIPEGSVVINLPYDGSVFSYGVTGNALAYQKIFYRPSDLTVIQNDLKDVSTNEEVQKAVEEMGARYVLLLDVGDIDENGQFLDNMCRVWWDGTQCDWSGIYDIDDSTPGFKVLLSEGDMRLYEIELPDAA